MSGQQRRGGLPEAWQKRRAGAQAGAGLRPPRIRVSIAPNPSHLEAIGPVVLGMVRAEQARLADLPAHARVAGLLIHGDAAFSGLGIVAETLQLANVPGACRPAPSRAGLAALPSRQRGAKQGWLEALAAVSAQALRLEARCMWWSTTRSASRPSPPTGAAARTQLTSQGPSAHLCCSAGLPRLC